MCSFALMPASGLSSERLSAAEPGYCWLFCLCSRLGIRPVRGKAELLNEYEYSTVFDVPMSTHNNLCCNYEFQGNS